MEARNTDASLFYQIECSELFSHRKYVKFVPFLPLWGTLGNIPPPQGPINYWPLINESESCL